MAIDREQVEIASKLNSLMDSMARSAERLEKSFESQVSVMEKLQATVNQISTQKAQQELSSLNQTKLNDLQKSIDSTSELTQMMIERIQDAGKELNKKFPVSVGLAAGALSGLYQDTRNVIALSKSVSSFFASFIDGAVTLGASIIAIPFKMFNALVDLAAKSGGGANELAQAIENLRKELGDLKGPGASAVIATSQTLQGFADTGLSVMRVFGTLAERIELVTKVAVAMGATFGRLTTEFRENGGALLAFQKGLGVTDEQMKSIGDRSITMGKKMSKTFLEMTKQTLALGKAFDIDQKLIGKDMAKALQDVKHFGALAVKEIAQASVYSRKLGLELDKITGTLDAFETFDSAAENVAKLSQTFGVSLDTFKLMEAQNPAEQLDMLRDSFRKAGVDASQFTRQQARMLAMSTNLDEAVVRQAFSASNYGTSLQDIKKKSEAAEKKTMSQAEAMSRLADSIERLVKSGGSQEGGFWDMFVKGFLGGIQASKEFREIIMNIKKGLNTVYIEGLRLGKAFVELFPGVKQVLGGIADFFKPQKFKMLAKGVVDELIQFMKDLSDPNGKASFTGLMKKLREKFFDFFNAQLPAGKKMLDGFKTVFRTISRLAGEGIKWAADKIAEGLKFVVEIIKDPSKLSDLMKAGQGTLGFLGEILMPLVEGLQHAWKVIAPVAFDLLKVVAMKIVDYLRSDEFANLIKPAIPYIAAAMFGPVLGRAMLGALTTSIMNASVGMLSGAGKKAIESLGKKVSDVAAASQAASSKNASTAALDQAGAVNAAAGRAINADKKSSWSVKDAVKLVAKLVAIAAALSIGGIMMAGALVAMKKILDAGGIKGVEDVVGPVIVLGTMVTAAIPLMMAMKLASKLGSIGDVLKGGLVISAAVGIVGVVGAGLAAMLKKVASPSELSAAGNMMLKMSLVFLAMVPLILASIAVGALASGPQAIALGVAAIGMSVIGAAVGDMATISVGIIKEISALKVDSDFQRKIDAFLGVMKAIQAFTDSLVNVIGLMTPSFTEFLTGTGTSFTEKVDAATKLIAEMVGQRGGGKGIIGVVEVVMESIKKINVTDGLVEAAKIFGDVMSAMAELMKAMTPPDAFYEEAGSFLNKLMDPSHNFQSVATDVAYFSRLMRENAMEMMTGKPDGSGRDGIIGLVEKMSTLSVPSPESAQVVANLLSSTAGILKAITPSADTMKSFTETSEVSTMWGLVKTNTSELNTDAIKTTVTTMAEKLAELLPVLVSGVITTVTDLAKELTPSQIENVKSLGGLMATVSSIAGSIVGLAKGKKVTPQEVAGAVHWAVEEAPNIEELFKGIGASLPMLLESVIKTVSGIKIDSSLAKHLEDAQKLFAFVAEVPKLATALSQSHGKEGGDVSNIEPLIQSVKSMTTFMQRLTADYGRNPIKDLLNNIASVGKAIASNGGDKVVKTAELLKNLFGTMATLGNSLKTILTSQTIDPTTVGKSVANIIESVSQSLTPLKKVETILTPEAMKQVSSSANLLKNYSTEVSKIANALKNDAIATSLKAASDLVKVANDLDTALNNGIKIDTPVKLQKLATAVGLGSKTNYTITNKMVQLTVNLNVTMDVGEVEKVMIMRQQSIIRERLNFALDQPSDKASPPIPDSFNSGFNAGNLAGSSP